MRVGPLELTWRRKEHPVAPHIAGVLGGITRVSFPTIKARHYVQDGLNANIAVYRAVMLLASGKAGIPRCLYRKLGIARENRNRFTKVLSTRTAAKAWAQYRQTGDQRLRKAVETAEVEQHPLLSLLDRPNPLQGGVRFEAWRYAFKLVHGNSFVVTAGPSKGAPRELWILRPERVEIEPDPIELVGAYVHRLGGREERFEPRRVWHSPMFAADDDFRGMSPLQVAMRTVLTYNEAVRWNYGLLKNSARPPMGAVAKDGLTDIQFNRLRAQIDELYTGSENAGRPLLGEAGIEFKPLGFTPAEMEWLAGLKDARRSIATVYGIAPELLGDAENKTYSNFQEARKALYLENLLPAQDEDNDDLNNWLVPQFGDGLYLDTDRDQIEALQEDQTALWSRVEAASVLRVNEKRAALGYDDLPDDAGGQAVLVSSALTPLDVLLQAEEPAPEPDPEPAPEPAPEPDPAPAPTE